MDDLNLWRAARLTALQAEDGWLNLTDRVEIGAGPQRVGRAGDNDLVLSVGPDHLGVLTVTDAGAQFQAPGQGAIAFQPSSGGFAQARLSGLSIRSKREMASQAVTCADLSGIY